MTTLASAPVASPAPGPALLRTELALQLAQLDGIGRWAADERAAGTRIPRPTSSREDRLDLARVETAREAVRQTVRARAEAHLAETGVAPLRTGLVPRALLAHRHDWIRGRTAACLAGLGISVIGETISGAEALGRVIVDQPDLLLVEDSLPLVSGREVVASARRYAPETRIVAYVSTDGMVGPLLEAGADLVHTRRVPPADVAYSLAGLVPLPATC